MKPSRFLIFSTTAHRQAILAVTLLLGLCLSLFSQDRTFRNLDLEHKSERLEPALASSLNLSRGSEAFRVIVQFSEKDGFAGGLENGSISGEGTEEQATAAGARLQAIYSAGARPEKVYGSLPVVAAVADRAALKRLAGDPRVERVSLDHPVHSSLNTTARAIGADQLWTALGTRPAFTGRGVTVAVIDSDVSDNTDLAGMVSKTIALDDIPRAFDDLRAGEVIRSVVTL